MADDERLVFHLSSGGDVVIKLRPDLAPGHVERIKELDQQRLLRRRAVPPRDPGLHGPGRRSDRARHRRLGPAEPQGRVQQRAARPRRLLDGPHAGPEQRQQPVLHLLRRRALPRQPVHRLGRGRERHGACRRASEGRAAGESRQDRQGRNPAGELTMSRGRCRADHRSLRGPRSRIRAAAFEEGHEAGPCRSAQGPPRCSRGRAGQRPSSRDRPVEPGSSRDADARPGRGRRPGRNARSTMRASGFAAASPSSIPPASAR